MSSEPQPAAVPAEDKAPSHLVVDPAPTQPVSTVAPMPSPHSDTHPRLPFVPQFPTYTALVTYSLRSFAKSFLIGYGAHTGFHLILRIIKLLRSSPRTLLNIDAVFGAAPAKARADAVRLGFFFGGFTGLFEFTYSLLDRIRGADDGWNAAAAGAVAGLSILFQRGDAHRTLALYLFARVVQCVYNGLKARGKVSPLPHGDAMLFSVSSAIVMYCYVLRPDALPRSFYNFILRTGPISETALRVVRHTTYNVPFNTEPVKTFIRAHYANSPVYFNWWSAQKAAIVPAAAVPALAAAASATATTTAATSGAVSAASAPAPAAGALSALNSLQAWMWSTLQAKRAAAKLRLAAVRARAAASATAAAVNAASTAAGAAAPVAELTADIALAKPLLRAGAAAATTAAATAAVPLALSVSDATALREAVIHQLIGPGGAPAALPGTLDAAAGIRGRAAAWSMPNVTSEAVSAAKRRAGELAASVAAASVAAATAAAAPGACNSACGHAHGGAKSPAAAAAAVSAAAAAVGKMSRLDRVLLLSQVPRGAAVVDSCGSTFAKLPCVGLHPQVPHSCTSNAMRVFYDTVAKILPLYSSLTVVPLVVFKNFKLLRAPLRYAAEASWSILRSCFFLGSFTSVYQAVICAHRNATGYGGRESKFNIFFAGIVCGFISILFERKSRRSELALYVLPRAVDAVLYLLREKRLVPGPLLGSHAVENVWVWCAAMGALSYYFIHEPQHVSGLVYTVMKFLFGRDPAAMKAQIKAAHEKAAHEKAAHDKATGSTPASASASAAAAAVAPAA